MLENALPKCMYIHVDCVSSSSLGYSRDSWLDLFYHLSPYCHAKEREKKRKKCITGVKEIEKPLFISFNPVSRFNTLTIEKKNFQIKRLPDSPPNVSETETHLKYSCKIVYVK